MLVGIEQKPHGAEVGDGKELLAHGHILSFKDIVLDDGAGEWREDFRVQRIRRFGVECHDLFFREAQLPQPQRGVLFQITRELPILALGLEQRGTVKQRQRLARDDFNAVMIGKELVDAAIHIRAEDAVATLVVVDDAGDGQ